MCRAWPPGAQRISSAFPTPAAAGVIAALVHGFKTPLHDERWAMAWLFLAAALGALMTSTIRYYSFRTSPGPAASRPSPSFSVPIRRRRLEIFGSRAGPLRVHLHRRGLVLQIVRSLRHRVASRTRVINVHTSGLPNAW